jgi:hypothetical protein
MMTFLMMISPGHETEKGGTENRTDREMVNISYTAITTPTPEWHYLQLLLVVLWKGSGLIHSHHHTHS